MVIFNSFLYVYQRVDDAPTIKKNELSVAMFDYQRVIGAPREVEIWPIQPTSTGRWNAKV